MTIEKSKFDWEIYHRLVRPMTYFLITVLTIALLIWVFWFLNPTVTTNGEFTGDLRLE